MLYFTVHFIVLVRLLRVRSRKREGEKWRKRKLFATRDLRYIVLFIQQFSVNKVIKVISRFVYLSVTFTVTFPVAPPLISRKSDDNQRQSLIIRVTFKVGLTFFQNWAFG